MKMERMSIPFLRRTWTGTQPNADEVYEGKPTNPPSKLKRKIFQESPVCRTQTKEAILVRNFLDLFLFFCFFQSVQNEGY